MLNSSLLARRSASAAAQVPTMALFTEQEELNPGRGQSWQPPQGANGALLATKEQLVHDSATGLTEKQKETRKARMTLRDSLSAMTTKESVAHCGRAMIPGQVARIVVKGGVASFSGLQQCGNIWQCPTCSAKVRQSRALEIERVATAHLKAGGGLYFPTFTTAHEKYHGLQETFDLVTGAFSTLMAGPVWSGRTRRTVKKGKVVKTWRENGEKDTYGIIGYLRSIEVTIGDNGWHPHIHALIFTEKPLSKDAEAALRDAWFSRYEAFIVKQGRKAPSKVHGMDWQQVRSAGDVSQYLSKVQDEHGTDRNVHMEIARGDLKQGRRKGRTPFQLLTDALATGEVQDLAKWYEYEEVTHNRKAITWSNGLRTRYDVEEVSDEELANTEEDMPTETINLSESEIQLLWMHGARLELLEAAERGGKLAVRATLDRLEARREEMRAYSLR